MQLFLSSRRVLVRAVCLLALLILGASLAEAAPGLTSRGGGRQPYDSHLTSLRKLLRRQQSFGGPVRTHRLKAAAEKKFGPWARIQRAKRVHTVDDDEAIQNDAPAARFDHGDDLPALAPLGMLAHVVDAIPVTHASSPRAPRGPPPPA